VASLEHEELVELFRSDPELAIDLIRGVPGVQIPRYQTIEVKPADLVDLIPVSYRADVLVLLLDGKPVFVIIVEVQLDRDLDKLYSWPLYSAAARARYRCPTCIVVYAPDQAIAAWCTRPIDLGQPDSPFRPLVRGPEAIPVVTDPAEAIEHPYRAVLSVVAHGDSEQAEAIGKAAMAGIAGFPTDVRATWEAVILAGLNEAARVALEAKMALNPEKYLEKHPLYRKAVTEGERKGLIEGERKGRIEGEAQALLTMLAARGIPVSDAARERIIGCEQLDVIEGWIRRALTVSAADELFAAPDAS
jgi:hypothetical protein